MFTSLLVVHYGMLDPSRVVVFYIIVIRLKQSGKHENDMYSAPLQYECLTYCFLIIYLRDAVTVEVLSRRQFRRSLCTPVLVTCRLHVDLLSRVSIAWDYFTRASYGRRHASHAIRIFVGNWYSRSILYVNRPL